MMCPQCNAELGEGAKACAACGWTASKKKIWLILGIVFGVLFLACCGIGTWFMFKMKKVAEALQHEVVPLQISVLHAQVVNYAKKHGKAPATLEEAASEAFEEKDGETVKKVEVKMEQNGKTVDMWQHVFRYTPAEDRSFEVRSAGPDGTFDNADDIFEKGSLDDDLPTLMKEIKARTERMGKEVLKSFGVDPDKLDGKKGGGGGGGDGDGTGGGGGGGGK